MRWTVLVGIVVGLLPSTAAYLAAFPVALGTFLGVLVSMAAGAEIFGLVVWLGTVLLCGVCALPPLWMLSCDRLRGRRPASRPPAFWLALATGCLLGTGAAASLLVIDVIDPTVLLITGYLLIAPVLLAVRELHQLVSREG